MIKVKIIFLNNYDFRYVMPQVTANGRVTGVKTFDDDMKAEVTLSTNTGTITLKLTDNKESAFSGMVALASSAMLIQPGVGPPISLYVTYDDDDREINEMELR
jgi:hypothetical protein